MQGHEIALTQNSATIANGASTVIAVAALGISSRHNYIGSIRGKGIECPRTLANLRLPLCPPAQGSLSFVSRPQSNSRTLRQALEIIKPKLPQVEINASSLCEAVAPVSTLLTPQLRSPKDCAVLDITHAIDHRISGASPERFHGC